MIVKPTYVYKMMQDNDCRFFTLCEGREVVGEQQEDDCNVDDAIQQLKEILAEFQSSTVDIKISNRCNAEKAKGGKGYKNYSFKIKLGTSVTGNAEASSNVVMLEKIKNLEIKLLEKDFEYRMKELERKFDERDKDGIGGIAEKFAPYLPMIFGMPAQPVPGINGVDGDDGRKQNVKELQQRLKAALSEIAKVDTDYVTTLEYIATLAQTQPQNYLQYAQILKAAATGK